MNELSKGLLIEKVRRIWRMESEKNPNWGLIEEYVNSAFEMIIDQNAKGEIDNYIIKYLDDVDIRKIDKKYGDYQREKIRSILDL